MNGIDILKLEELKDLPTPFYIIRTDGDRSVPVMLSVEAEDLIGYDLDAFADLYARDPMAFIETQNREKVARVFGFSNNHPGTAFDTSMRFIKSNGIVLNLMCWGKTVAADGDVRYRITFLKELTSVPEEFEMNDSSYSVALYDMLMASSNIGIISIDITDEYRLIWCNEAAHSIIGYTKFKYETEFHSSLGRFFEGNEEEYERVKTAIIDARRRGVPRFDLNVRLNSKHGQVWLSGTATFSGYRSSDHEGNMVYYAFTDITEGVKQRRKLEEARQAADLANESKSAFLSSMSHDIRTPLNGIVGFTDLALKEEDPCIKQEYLKKIQYASILLTDIVNDTLDLSRIESGRMTLERELVNSHELGSSVAQAIKPAADIKGVRMIADASRYPSENIWIDRLKIQKIIINLLSNAIKYTPPGGTVTLTVCRLDPPIGGCTRRLLIEDTGIGISDDFLPRMFEPFAQEHRPEAGNVEGTGLGLAIVSKMVELMQGNISVESKVGSGTTIIVDLPIELAEGANAAEAEVKTMAKSLNGRRVLLAEDNRINMEIATILLREAGVDYEWAENGEKAVEKFSASEEQYYDAVLMDVRMPVMNGYEAAEAIRNLDRSDAAEVPIIAMTADAFTDDIRKCLEAGMNAHVAKPIDPQRLYTVIASLVK